MRLIAISSVKNEQDIVEAFVRHTTATCDHLLVVDHHSSDATRQILEALIAEGLPLQLLTADRQITSHSERVTPLMRAAAAMGADWVIPLDADEFLDASRSQLEEALRAHDSPVLVRWQSFVPTEHDSAADLNPVTRIRHRLRKEIADWCKVLVPRHVAATGTLTQGSHDIAGDGESPRRVLTDIAMAHFPIRSAAQYAVKVAIANLQWTALGNRGGFGFHYVDPFERLVRGWPEFSAGFAADALRYAVPPEVTEMPELVEMPMSYLGGMLRHTPASEPEPWPQILRYVFGLAEEMGTLRSRATHPTPAAGPLEADSLRRELADAHTLLQELRSHNEALLQSTSWRVTRPLRALGRRLRRRPWS